MAKKYVTEPDDGLAQARCCATDPVSVSARSLKALSAKTCDGRLFTVARAPPRTPVVCS